VTLLEGFIAFMTSATGQALLAVVPTLFEDVIAIWHKNGTITSSDIVTYVAAQKSFDSLVPKKNG
jgi:hypothetical protein